MTHSKGDHLNGDRLYEIDCWCDRLKIITHSNSDRLKITTHSNSDRLLEIDC
ncbi:hypothetical protein [Pseudanabaena sp. UWO311]|uniref:hypothetical protein n=1 Tax=Pseudanabaena sp. UWO311 TaxID=2487337 RepID=UPI00168008C4|nr:hypothetical protein [Pseudanabaena sp. UWO311]